MQADHQPSNAPQKQPQAWETTLLQALSTIAPNGAGHIDCSILERALSTHTAECFTPMRSSAVIQRLTELGIHCIVGSRGTGDDFITRPKLYREKYINEQTVDFFNGVFSNPLCSLYLAPSLLGSVIYSPNRLIHGDELSRDNGVLSVFRQGFLTSTAMSGMLSELRRHLIIRCTMAPSIDSEHFSGYALALPVSEREHHRPFFIEHAQQSLINILSEKKELPLELTRLLNFSCGDRLFDGFPYQAITEWLATKLEALSVEFDQQLKQYQKIVSDALEIKHRADRVNDDYEPENGLEKSFAPGRNLSDVLEEIEISIEDSKGRFNSCLELILNAVEGCKPFHLEHLQDADIPGREKPKKKVRANDDDFELDPNPPANSALLQTLTRCTLSMLAVLGQPELGTPLELVIPDNLAQALRARFNWYPDDFPPFESFYQKDVTECLLRYIAKCDFTSACSLIVIAPSPMSSDGRLTLPYEIEEPLKHHHDFICLKVAEKIAHITKEIAELTPLERDEFGNISPFAAKFNSFYEQTIESALSDLKRGVATLLISPVGKLHHKELGKQLGSLLMMLTTYNPGYETAETGFGHRGFEMIFELRLKFGEQGEEYFNRIFESVLSASPVARGEFSKFITRCNLEAAELIKSHARYPHAIAEHERQLMLPVRLYELLPASFRGQAMASPGECISAVRLLRRGRELREDVSMLETEREMDVRQLNPFDVERQVEIIRENRRGRNLDTDIPLSLSLSLTSHLKHGTLALTPALRPLAGEAQMVIARASVNQIKEIASSAERNTVIETIFINESQLLRGVLPTLTEGHASRVIPAANIASEFYAEASRQFNKFDRDTAASMNTLSRAFKFLSAQLKPLECPPGDPQEKSLRLQALEVIRDFVDHYSIQDLIQVLHLEQYTIRH